MKKNFLFLLKKFALHRFSFCMSFLKKKRKEISHFHFHGSCKEALEMILRGMYQLNSVEIWNALHFEYESINNNTHHGGSSNESQPGE